MIDLIVDLIAPHKGKTSITESAAVVLGNVVERGAASCICISGTGSKDQHAELAGHLFNCSGGQTSERINASIDSVSYFRGRQGGENYSWHFVRLA